MFPGQNTTVGWLPGNSSQNNLFGEHFENDYTCRVEVGWSRGFFFFFLPVVPIPGCCKYSSEFCIDEGKALLK